MNIRDLLDEVDVLGCKLTFLPFRSGWKCIATYDERIAAGVGLTPAAALEQCLHRIHQGLAA